MANLKKKYLRLGLLNARSLNTGKDELHVTILKHTPDILAINETWLKEGEESLAPKFSNYRFIHKARKTKKGGGVGFYIKQGILIKVHQHPESILEQMWLEIRLPGTTMAVGTAYRPESVSISEALDSLSESMNLMGHCDSIWILGDFNVDMAQTDSSKTQEILHFCYQRSLEQLIREPTRVTDRSQSTIDLIMTDNPHKCKNTLVSHNRCLSDHALVVVDLDIKKPKLQTRVIFQRAIKDIALDKFTKDLTEIPWFSIYDLDNLDSMIENFNFYITQLFDFHAPMRKIIIKDQPKPWITNMIKFMMTLRDDALTKAQKDKTDSSKNYYRNLKNLVTAAIERERKAYFIFSINNNIKKPALMWKNIKNSIQKDERINYIPDQLRDPDLINDHFLNLPPSDNTDTNTNFVHNFTQGDTLELRTTTETEVEKIINEIKTRAAGEDNINIDMIKLTLNVTLPIITRIVNKSIETNTFPSSWKRALVKPIPKKSNVSELKDLRPISILPVLSKILEKVILLQVSRYLEDIKVIPKFQSGFRRGHSTETALLHVTDDLSEASDVGLSSIMVLLDYTRAFDCLDQNILLTKLKSYGFSLNTCHWFKTFLSNREQRVVIEDTDGKKRFSSSKHVQRGVPQGSLLSPILFTIFTADMPYHIKSCKYHLYADDTQLYYSFNAKDAKTAIKIINEDLNNIYEWSQNNSLALNPSKSQTIIFGTQKQYGSIIDCGEKIKINGVNLEQVNSARNLGLILDREQKFKEHINNKVKTAFFRLKTLYKIRPYIKTDLRIILCDSLVLSQFNYCSLIYGPRLNANLERAIQRVQNACIRFCFNVPKRQFITPYLNKNGILNMSARRNLQYACTIHRVIWSKKPDYLFEKLLWVKDFSHCNARSNTHGLLRIPNHKSTRYRGCFKFSAAKIWNDLPPPLRKKMSTECFKGRYKAALLKRQLAAENLKHTWWQYLQLKKFFT